MLNQPHAGSISAFIAYIGSQKGHYLSEPAVTTKKSRSETLLIGMAVVLAVFLANPGPKAVAQDTVTFEEPTVHWAYASYFGTGTYKINDAQSAFVINAAADWLEGESHALSLSDDPGKYRIRIPITMGLASIDLGDVPEILDPGNLSLAGIGLGADIDIPVNPQWSLRPNVQVGQGRILGSSDYAWTYRADIRARYIHDFGSVKGALIGATGAVGFKPNRGLGDNFAYTELGAELEIPVDSWSSGTAQWRVFPHIKYTQLPVQLEVQTTRNSTAGTNNFIDLGVAFGRADRPLKWWFIELDRLGLATTFSTTSNVVGIKLIVESLYEL